MVDRSIEAQRCATYEQDGLPGHPAYRQHRAALDAVVVGTVQRPTHAEVGDLDGVQVADEAVAGGQVAMNHVQRLEVLHAGRDLGRHVDQTPVAAYATPHIRPTLPHNNYNYWRRRGVVVSGVRHERS